LTLRLFLPGENRSVKKANAALDGSTLFGQTTAGLERRAARYKNARGKNLQEKEETHDK
jgi:hypothetical protein